MLVIVCLATGSSPSPSTYAYARNTPGLRYDSTAKALPVETWTLGFGSPVRVNMIIPALESGNRDPKNNLAGDNEYQGVGSCIQRPCSMNMVEEWFEDNPDSDLRPPIPSPHTNTQSLVYMNMHAMHTFKHRKHTPPVIVPNTWHTLCVRACSECSDVSCYFILTADLRHGGTRRSRNLSHTTNY